MDSDSDWDELDIAAEVVDVAAELTELRAGVAAAGDEDSYFHVIVRGGAWTLEHKGVPTDACAGKARGGLARTWCRSFKFPAMASMSFKKYSREGALELAREYCRRGTFFFRLWLDVEGAGEEFKYTQANVDSYAPHPDWAVFKASVPVGSVSHRRAVKLDALKPRLG